MIFKCFVVVRAIGERAHHIVGHAVHRFFGSHGVHANRAFAHGLAHVHITSLPTMVCIAAGIAAVGASGLVIRSAAPGSSPPGVSSVLPGVVAPFSPPTLPTSFGQTQAGSLLDTLVRSHWNEIGSQDTPPFALAVGETGAWPDTATLPVWAEGNSPPVAPIPTGFNSGGIPDTPNPTMSVPEPASISLFGAYLLGFATPWRRILMFCQRRVRS